MTILIDMKARYAQRLLLSLPELSVDAATKYPVTANPFSVAILGLRADAHTTLNLLG